MSNDKMTSRSQEGSRRSSCVCVCVCVCVCMLIAFRNALFRSRLPGDDMQNKSERITELEIIKEKRISF